MDIHDVMYNDPLDSRLSGATEHFVTTQWTRVLAARGQTPEAKQALCDLCGAYYAPVVAFLRRSGRYEDQARELAHEFFAQLLGRHGVDGADPQRGRFRSYLLGAVKHFLAHHHAARSREKRGGGGVHQPIGGATDTSPGLDIPDPGNLPPDVVFDREWALRVLDRALAALARECQEAGNLRVFETLKPWLTGDRAEPTQASASRSLDMTEGAVRVTIHRLRQRFRALVRAEIAQTVDAETEVSEELRHLIAALS
jgi:RNA polymerase sigma-70 factor (ECF subfamily)